MVARVEKARPAKIGEEVILMSTMTARSEDVMTDFQFRALMRMVLEIIDNNEIQKARKVIENLAEGKTSTKDLSEDN
jgi:hypothetical protein